MPNTTQKAKQKHKPNHPQMDCLSQTKIHTYLKKIHGPAMRERNVSCGHKNIVASPHPTLAKNTQPLDQIYPLRAQTGSKNYSPAPSEEKIISIVR